ncbi:hypothetical protein BUALT_Bualt03G0053500 [Buddleja alternifolia]|uniref:Protein E6 n=1 Tax=Buddleja alternifolia TaxID=168488 RepID=A0AAV6XZL7_9LAMI|nr:hypothetical protein BUALT_Bualt03G0053500 [Buddleja alternifolia]
MASSAKQFSLFFLLLTLLSSLHTHARDSQFFNKIPSTTTNVVVPNNKQTQINQQEQQPDFLPDNENSYGLYGHESGQLPPSATTADGKPALTTTADGKPALTTATTPYNTASKQPLPKYLPKNYNPTAYVTQPEDMHDSTPFTEEKSYTTNPNSNYNYNEGQNYYNSQKNEEESEYRSSYPATNNRNNNNNNYRLGSSFNSQPEGLSDTRWGGAALTSRENYKNNGGEATGSFQVHGMSDTRLVENGKYFYDVNNEKYNRNHPYERLRSGVNVGGRNDQYNNYNNRNYYGNSENVNEFNGEMNSMGGSYQNQDEFQEEGNSMP